MYASIYFIFRRQSRYSSLRQSERAKLVTLFFDKQRTFLSKLKYSAVLLPGASEKEKYGVAD